MYCFVDWRKMLSHCSHAWHIWWLFCKIKIFLPVVEVVYLVEIFGPSKICIICLFYMNFAVSSFYTSSLFHIHNLNSNRIPKIKSPWPSFKPNIDPKQNPTIRLGNPKVGPAITLIWDHEDQCSQLSQPWTLRSQKEPTAVWLQALIFNQQYIPISKIC